MRCSNGFLSSHPPLTALLLNSTGTFLCMESRAEPSTLQFLQTPRVLSRMAVARGHARLNSTAMLQNSMVHARRAVTSASAHFDHIPFRYRLRHTYDTLPMHDANRWGGRTAYLREIGPFDHKKKGRLFKRNHELLQWNVDIWSAQQTLRKRWKQRDWVVVEVPFQLAPKELQRVIPDLYTDVPVLIQDGTDRADGETSAKRYRPPESSYHHFSQNVRQKVYDIEALQEVLFGEAQPYPLLQRLTDSSSNAVPLDKFL